MIAAHAINQMFDFGSVTISLVYLRLERRDRDMKTKTIDIRTDAILKRCLESTCPVSVLAYDYAEGDVIPTHDHKKAQLIYGIEGSMMVTTSEGTWALLPTRGVWVPANTRHSIQMRSAVRMRSAYFDQTIFAQHRECAVVAVSPLLRELIVSMLQEPRDYREKDRGSHLAALITSELDFTKVLPLHIPWPSDPRLKRICKAMQRHPHLSGNMEYWASQAEMSSRSLARLFRTDLKMSFQEWRTRLLVLEAQIRLSEHHPSSRVASSLGYESHAAFSAMFRKSLGVSPSDYVRLIQAT